MCCWAAVLGSAMIAVYVRVVTICTKCVGVCVCVSLFVVACTCAGEFSIWRVHVCESRCILYLCGLKHSCAGYGGRWLMDPD